MCQIYIIQCLTKRKHSKYTGQPVIFGLMWRPADTDTGKSIYQKVSKTRRALMSIASTVGTDISAKINNNLS